MIVLAAVNGLALAVFGVVLLMTLAITYWASKRTSTATEFWAAGRGISGVQNGFAIAGDYLSASTFLGFSGLIFLYGLDGWVGLAAAGMSFLPLILLLAERMRNAGKFTSADVLAFRLNDRPARVAAALGTLSVALVYLVAQMIGAGVLIQALIGVDFTIAVVGTGALMILYVITGGMLATTWVQIIKAGLLMTAGAVLTLLVLNRTGWNPVELFDQASPTTRTARPTSRPACRTPTSSAASPSASRSCSAPRACPTSSCASSRCPTRAPPARRWPGASCSSGSSS